MLTKIDVVHSIVSSTIEWIQSLMEQSLDKDGESTNYKKYMRFWEMMELLNRDKKIPRHVVNCHVQTDKCQETPREQNICRLSRRAG